MIFVINPNLFSYSSKLANPFEKIQLHDLSGEKRIVTLMTDREHDSDIDSNYVNIRSRSGDLSSSGDTEVLIRSCSTNKYDGNFIVAAVPFNGVLLPTLLSNFRFRYAEVVEIGENFQPTKEEYYPKGLRYKEVTKVIDAPEKILYCVIEPNTSVMFDPKHPNHTENVFINIPFAAYDDETDCIVSNTNFRISLQVVAYPPASEVGALGRGALKVEASYAPRRMVPKVMAKLRNDVLFQLKAEKNMPYPIYFQPTKEEKKENKKALKNKKPVQTNQNSKRSDEWIEDGGTPNKYANLNKRNKNQGQKPNNKGKKKKKK